MSSKNKKPSLMRRAAVGAIVATASLGAVGTPEVSAETQNQNVNWLSAIITTHANLMPKVAGSIMRMCGAYPANCYLKDYKDGTYGFGVHDIADPKAPGQYTYDASVIIDRNKRLLGFSTDRVDATTYQRRGLQSRPEGICDGTTMGDQCFASVLSSEYRGPGQSAPINVVGSVGGLAISDLPISGANYRTSHGDVHDYPTSPSGALFLTMLAVNDLDAAARQVAR